jgi:hypothetical protein
MSMGVGDGCRRGRGAADRRLRFRCRDSRPCCLSARCSQTLLRRRSALDVPDLQLQRWPVSGEGISIRRWRRCLSITASTCGCPRSAAGSTSPQRIMREPLFCVAIGWRLAASRVAADPGYLRGVGIAAETGGLRADSLAGSTGPAPAVARETVVISPSLGHDGDSRGALVCETAISSLLPARLRPPPLWCQRY